MPTELEFIPPYEIESFPEENVTKLTIGMGQLTFFSAAARIVEMGDFLVVSGPDLLIIIDKEPFHFMMLQYPEPGYVNQHETAVHQLTHTWLELTSDGRINRVREGTRDQTERTFPVIRGQLLPPTEKEPAGKTVFVQNRGRLILPFLLDQEKDFQDYGDFTLVSDKEKNPSLIIDRIKWMVQILHPIPGMYLCQHREPKDLPPLYIRSWISSKGEKGWWAPRIF